MTHENIIEEINELWVQGHFDTQQRDVFVSKLTQRNIRYGLETGFCTGTSCLTALATCKPKKGFLLV